METRHVRAVLFARDFRHLATFYRDAVGAAQSRQLDDHAILSCPGFELIVHQIPARFLTATPTALPRRREEGTIKLWFPVDDLDRVRRTIATLGGVVDPPEREWVSVNERTCLGHDPEGNVFQLSMLLHRSS
jgi:predicted enzyme related to lactoylglutathione lyase